MADVKNNDRKNRLSAALRENLKRRKQQLRGRASQPAEGRDGDAEPRVDIASDPAGKTSRDDRD